MLVREQVFIVDGHVELTVGAQDLELQQQNRRPSPQLYSVMLVIPEVDKMKYLTWNGCPSTKGNLVSSLSSRPQILPIQLFLTITFLPFSLKRGLKWKARSRDVTKSMAILSDNTKKHGSTSDIKTGSSTTTWSSIACSFSTVSLVLEQLTRRGEGLMSCTAASHQGRSHISHVCFEVTS